MLTLLVTLGCRANTFELDTGDVFLDTDGLAGGVEDTHTPPPADHDTGVDVSGTTTDLAFEPETFILRTVLTLDSTGRVKYGKAIFDFQGSSESETCTWVGKVRDSGQAGTPTDSGAVIARTVSLHLKTTDCGGFDSDDWGETTPTTAIEDMEMTVAYAVASDALLQEIPANKRANGFATWYVLTDPSSGSEVTAEAGWTFVKSDGQVMALGDAGRYKTTPVLGFYSFVLF